MWWGGKYALSHGTNTIAGVAILFPKDFNINILSVDETAKGRALLTKVESEGITFVVMYMLLIMDMSVWVFYGIEISHSEN